MPTKRQRVTRNARARITPAAIEAFRSGDDQALTIELRLRPWEASPLDAVGDALNDGTAYAESWPQAVELRDGLEKACAH